MDKQYSQRQIIAERRSFRDGAAAFLVLRGNDFTVLCLEKCAYKIVEVGVYTVISVISALNIVPDVGHSVLGEAVMVAAWDIVYCLVIASRRDKEDMGLLAALPTEAARNSGSGTYSSDIAEKVGALHTYEKRFSSAH